jgi:nucleotide-binding universal stress UspA family protein
VCAPSHPPPADCQDGGAGLERGEWQQDHIADEIEFKAEVMPDEAAQRREEQFLRTRIEEALDGQSAPEGVRTELQTGNPTEVFADWAIRRPAGGWGGFRHLLTGSVASQLVDHAPCPVTVVPGGPPRHTAD